MTEHIETLRELMTVPLTDEQCAAIGAAIDALAGQQQNEQALTDAYAARDVAWNEIEQLRERIAQLEMDRENHLRVRANHADANRATQVENVELCERIAELERKLEIANTGNDLLHMRLCFGISTEDEAKTAPEWVERVATALGMHYDYDGPFVAAPSQEVVEHVKRLRAERDEARERIADLERERTPLYRDDLEAAVKRLQHIEWLGVQYIDGAIAQPDGDLGEATGAALQARGAMLSVLREHPRGPAVLGDAKWWEATCDACGWRGSSEHIDGCEPIADSGDYGDPLCPVCGAVVDDVEDMPPHRSQEGGE
jgi:hypothetical protein